MTNILRIEHIYSFFICFYLSSFKVYFYCCYIKICGLDR